MPPARLKSLGKYPFSVDLAVRVSDLNYGAHLGYDRLLGLVHEARIRLFESLGVRELQLDEANTGALVVDLIAVYKGEAFLGDHLTFEICPTEISKSAFRLCHRISCRKRRADIALVELGFVAFDYDRRRVAPLPGAFKGGLEALANEAS